MSTTIGACFSCSCLFLKASLTEELVDIENEVVLVATGDAPLGLCDLFYVFWFHFANSSVTLEKELTVGTPIVSIIDEG